MQCINEIWTISKSFGMISKTVVSAVLYVRSGMENSITAPNKLNPLRSLSLDHFVQTIGQNVY